MGTIISLVGTGFLIGVSFFLLSYPPIHTFSIELLWRFLSFRSIVCETDQVGKWTSRLVLLRTSFTHAVPPMWQISLIITDVQTRSCGCYHYLPVLDRTGVYWCIRHQEWCTYTTVHGFFSTHLLIHTRQVLCISRSCLFQSQKARKLTWAHMKVFVIIEYLAYLWYTLSYIPYARSAVLKVFGMWDVLRSRSDHSSPSEPSLLLLVSIPHRK